MRDNGSPVDTPTPKDEDDPPLGAGVACERTYQIVIDGAPQPLHCRWFVPKPWGSSWLCRMTITMADGHVRNLKTGGVDSAQALVLALQRVASELLDGDIPAFWFEEDDDLGLPCMDLAVADVAARKARFDARERSRRLWEPVSQMLWADWDPLRSTPDREKYSQYVRVVVGMLETDVAVERIADFLSELRLYIDGPETSMSTQAADLAMAHKLRTLVTSTND